jgi:peptidoglycan/xylan/chitin deacetylase (PgdA/CDA1 family)
VTKLVSAGATGAPTTRSVPIAAGGSTPAATTLLPQQLIIAPGTEYEAFENAADWTVANGTLAANTSEFKTGTQSLKLTANSGASATMTKTINWDLSSGSLPRIEFWYYQHDASADYSAMTLYLSNNSGMTNEFRWWLVYQGMFGPGWNHAVCPQSYFRITGNPVWTSPMIRIQLKVAAATSKTPSMSFDNFVIGTRAQAAILMRFDDGSIQQWNHAFQYLRQFNMRGSVMQIGNAIGGSSSALTGNQLREMYAAGWTICNHTHDHTDLLGMAEASQEAEFTLGMADLAAVGLPYGSKYGCLPGGHRDDNTLIALAATGMQVCSVGMGMDEVDAGPGQALAYPLPGDNSLYNIGNRNITTTVTVDQIIAGLEGAIAGGVIFPITFHALGTGTEWTPDNFHRFIDYVRGRILAGALVAITYDDLYKLTLGPVSIPAVI